MDSREARRDKVEGQAASEVLKADNRRFHAMINGDLDALDRLLAENLTYTHADGRTETKAKFLAALKFGRLKYERIEPSAVQVRTFGSSAVVTGKSQMWLRVEGKPLDFSIRYMAVYERQDETWRLVAWQSTRLPSA